MSEERKDDESGESDSSNRSGDEVLRDLGIPMQTMVYRPMAEERQINSHSVTSIITLVVKR